MSALLRRLPFQVPLNQFLRWVEYKSSSEIIGLVDVRRDKTKHSGNETNAPSTAGGRREPLFGASPVASSNHRHSVRTETFKRAKVASDGGTFDCIIRDVSDLGAYLHGQGIHDTSDYATLRGIGMMPRSVQVVWRGVDSLGVKFV